MPGSLSSLASLRASAPPRWLVWLAGGVPLAYYLASASAYGGLYDEGTFLAAARTLGVPHPPGAPISALVGAFFALLPAGSLAFRVSIASAVCASFTLALFARALFYTLLGVGVRDTTLCARLALAASWFVAGTPLFVMQATRPNVFAAQFALSLLVIDALVRFELSEPSDDRRPLYYGAFMQGLSFANHHVFGLLMLSVAAPTLGRVLARRGFLGLMGHVALPILGFSAYVYVPIRGGRHPFLNIGDPSSLLRSLWVLTADPWWGPSDIATPSTLAQFGAGLGTTRVVPLLLCAAALYGFVASARTESQRRFAVLWLIALLVPLASVAWIIEPKLTNDAWGALTPCALSLVALATTGLGLTLQRALRRFERPSYVGALGLAAAALLALVWHADARGLGSYRAPDALDDLSRRELATRAVVLTRDAGTWFRELGSESEEQLRRDVTLVPLAFLDYPGQHAALVAAAPELAPLLASFAHEHKLTLPALRALALQRPVYVELDDDDGPLLARASDGDGLFERVRDRASYLDREALHAREAQRFARLYQRLSEDGSTPRELTERLARMHRRKAIALATSGARSAALAHVRLGLHSAPDDASMRRLESALATAHPVPR